MRVRYNSFKRIYAMNKINNNLKRNVLSKDYLPVVFLCTFSKLRCDESEEIFYGYTPKRIVDNKETRHKGFLVIYMDWRLFPSIRPSVHCCEGEGDEIYICIRESVTCWCTSELLYCLLLRRQKRNRRHSRIGCHCSPLPESSTFVDHELQLIESWLSNVCFSGTFFNPLNSYRTQFMSRNEL